MKPADRSPSPHDAPPAATALRFGPLALAAREPARLAAFYRNLLGFVDHPNSTGGALCLGPEGGDALLELRPAETELPPPGGRRPPGLFHAAFLLPSRADLGRWLRHAAELTGGRLGQADHLVSEAFYLDDPEGNGVEVYRDRPRDAWPRDPDDPARVRMATDPADVEAILAAGGDDPWRGAPAATTLGHVHLRVSDLDAARRFWCGLLGFELMATYPGALFVALGGYHHHLGLNTWQSRRAEPAPDGAPGLAEVRIELAGAHLDAALARLGDAGRPVEPTGDRISVRDPDGIEVTLVRGD